jgi:hypothetical protein
LREGFGTLSQHKQVLGALSFLVAAVVLFVLYGPLNLFPASTEVSVAAPPPTEAAVAVVPVASVAAPVEVVASAPVVVASAPVVVASVPAQSTAPAAAPVASSSACAFSTEAMPQAAPFVARKEGTYVYVVSNANLALCVVDGNKQATVLQMKAGENRTVPGVAPWQISGDNLQHVQIYFQGGRVTLPEEASRRLKLVELPVTR